MRGLASDPGDRFASMDTLLDALGRARAGPRPGAVARWVALGATLVVVVALGAIVLVTSDDRESSSPGASASETGKPSHLRSTPITRTSGFGVWNVRVDPASHRMLYRDGDHRFWLRDLAGGIPTAVALPGEVLHDATFDPARQGLIFRSNQFLYRLGARGTVYRFGESCLSSSPSITTRGCSAWIPVTASFSSARGSWRSTWRPARAMT